MSEHPVDPAEQLHAIARMCSALAGQLAGRSSAGERVGQDPSAAARRLQCLRRDRDRLFGAELFADPAWDMLLALYVAEADGQVLSIDGLCARAMVPAAAALRWVVALEERGLVVRDADASPDGAVRLRPETAARVGTMLARF